MSSKIDYLYSNEFKIYKIIKYCKGPIPDELKFECWKRSFGVDGCKPIHFWIEYRPGESIPDELKFKGW